MNKNIHLDKIKKCHKKIDTISANIQQYFNNFKKTKNEMWWDKIVESYGSIDILNERIIEELRFI